MNRHKKQRHKLNREINYPKVRVLGNNIESKVVSLYEAQQIAESMDMDMILISENANPPVVRIEDYNKFLYNQEKIDKEKRKNSTKSNTKEIQLSVNIAENDLNTKSKKSIEFLEDGNKVKCVLSMKGRQNAMPEKGELVMLKFAQLCSEVGIPEYMPKLEGSKWIMIIKPKNK